MAGCKVSSVCWAEVDPLRLSLLQDYIILCLDTGPSMDAAPLDEGETRLETALNIASRVVQQKASPVLYPACCWPLFYCCLKDVCRQQRFCGTSALWNKWSGILPSVIYFPMMSQILIMSSPLMGKGTDTSLLPGNQHSRRWNSCAIWPIRLQRATHLETVSSIIFMGSVLRGSITLHYT